MPKRNDLLGWYKLRWQILSRDEYRCRYCGQSAPDVKLEVDHIIPIAEGGTDSRDNLITSCWACNRGKNGLRQSIVLARAKKAKPKPVLRQKLVQDLLTQNPRGITPSELAMQLGIKLSNVYVILSRLKARGRVKSIDKRWFITLIK